MTTHEELDDSPSYDKNEYYEGPSDEEDEDDGMDYYGGVKVRRNSLFSLKAKSF